MRFWRDDYYKTLSDLSLEASQSPEWSDYASFCSEYERGLRKQAFAILDRFIRALEHAPFCDRRRFVSWVMRATDGLPGQDMAVPHPLRVRVIEPTLLEWTDLEPSCSEPHRWLGGYQHLKAALKLDASDEVARRKLIRLVIGWIEYSTHELPIGYLGDPEPDLVLLEEVSGWVSGLSNEAEREGFTYEIEQQRVLIQSHLSSR